MTYHFLYRIHKIPPPLIFVHDFSSVFTIIQIFVTLLSQGKKGSHLCLICVRGPPTLHKRAGFSSCLARKDIEARLGSPRK